MSIYCFHVPFVKWLYRDSLCVNKFLPSWRVVISTHVKETFHNVFCHVNFYMHSLHLHVARFYVRIRLWYSNVWIILSLNARHMVLLKLIWCHFRHRTITVSRAFVAEVCQYIFLFILPKRATRKFAQETQYCSPTMYSSVSTTTKEVKY